MQNRLTLNFKVNFLLRLILIILKNQSLKGIMGLKLTVLLVFELTLSVTRLYFTVSVKKIASNVVCRYPRSAIICPIYFFYSFFFLISRYLNRFRLAFLYSAQVSFKDYALTLTDENHIQSDILIVQRM